SVRAALVPYETTFNQPFHDRGEAAGCVRMPREPEMVRHVAQVRTIAGAMIRRLVPYRSCDGGHHQFVTGRHPCRSPQAVSSSQTAKAPGIRLVRVGWA